MAEPDWNRLDNGDIITTDQPGFDGMSRMSVVVDWEAKTVHAIEYPYGPHDESFTSLRYAQTAVNLGVWRKVYDAETDTRRA